MTAIRRKVRRTSLVRLERKAAFGVSQCGELTRRRCALATRVVGRGAGMAQWNRGEGDA